MSCRLVKLDDTTYISAHKVVSVKAVPGDEEKCVVFMDSQSAASAKFLVEMPLDDAVEEINSALEEDE